MEGELHGLGQEHALMHFRPNDPAPPASAPYEQRAEWSDRYVNWFIAHTGEQGAMPADVDATHRYEIEFNSCVRDPQRYEKQTQQELQTETLH